MYIFGISPGPHGIKAYVHLTVIGRLNGEHLETLPSPGAPAHFPPFGKVRLDRVFGIPPAGTPGIWKVGPAALTNDPQADLVVVEKRLARTPTEIVRVPASSTDVSKLRRCLTDGITLGFQPHLPVLVLTEDGVVFGPITGDVVDTRQGSLLVPAEQLSEPLPMWQSLERLAPVEVTHEAKVRTFTSVLDLPPHDTYLDLARLPEALRAVASALGEGSDAWPTGEILARVTRCLRDPTIPPKYTARAERILSSLDRVAASRESLDTLMELMRHHPTVEHELAAVRATAREEERQRTRQIEVVAQEQIAALEAERTRLEQEVQDKRAAIIQAEADLAAREVAFGTRLKSRLDAMTADPSELLASVALLRPFLSTGFAQGKASETSISVRDSASGVVPRSSVRVQPLPHHFTRPSAPAPADLAAMREVLATEFRIVGLARPSAKLLAGDVLAAILSEQMVMLRGSIAPLIAHACARAITGARARVVRVPLGLAGDEEIRACVEEMREGAEAADGPAVLVLEGINRSALDGCGGCVRELVAAGLLDMPRDHGPLFLIATLDQGPAALPPSTALLDLGPLLELDILALSARGEEAGPLAAPAEAERWVAWMEAVLKASLNTDIVEAIWQLQGTPSVLWQRAVKLAAHALCAIGSNAGQQVDSLLYGWGLPRASATGLPAGQVLGTLRTVLTELPEGTGRARHLLQPLQAEGDGSDGIQRNGQRAYP